MTTYTKTHTSPYEDGTPPTYKQPLTGLLRDIINDANHLFRSEVNLAKTEVSEKINRARSGFLTYTAGVVLAVAGAIKLMDCLTALLLEVLSPWFAAFAVGAVALVVAIAMISSGSSKFKAESLKPEKTVNSLKKDKQTLQEHLR